VEWWVLGAWIGAVVLGAVVLGFCAYEVTWKGRRLSTDLERLSAMSQKLADLQDEVAALQAAQQRLTETHSASAPASA
jgi:outer membrane murein-binding lipoprotein Lpp